MGIKLLPIIINILLSITMLTGQDWDWVQDLPKPYTLSESEISTYLYQFQTRFPDYQDRLKALALWRLGTPYKIYQLGEEKEPDPDPIIRLDVSDCTAHVLTSIACAHSANWEEARQRMIDIHYKPDETGHKVPSYEKRWHFTADRITHNPYTVDITPSLLDKKKLVETGLVLNLKTNGEEFLDIDWQENFHGYYIPSEEITPALLQKLPEIAGIAFVRKDYRKNGILIAHEGMMSDRADVLHASMEAGATVRVPFMDYYFRDGGPLFDGVMFYRFVEQK
ncbi:MAG: N-acetylmuramoyl-L-alanine amidase-like domain-containing protein [Fidelibacterota bacterium]